MNIEQNFIKIFRAICSIQKKLKEGNFGGGNSSSTFTVNANGHLIQTTN